MNKSAACFLGNLTAIQYQGTIKAIITGGKRRRFWKRTGQTRGRECICRKSRVDGVRRPAEKHFTSILNVWQDGIYPDQGIPFSLKYY
ncbi:hypothetical protein [Anaeromassilibacillus senegalensis]|uniref:hypothetical protein n=1 Tax=Anaeromassilibacillus senegalensis TaxID=1673717 RepID=UPI00067FCAA8|nr:hypothetical protein [Anaeromassilibacillus senegalensis]